MGLIKPIGTIDRTITKSDIVKLGDDHAHQIIESGNYDLLKTYVEMKRYELYIKTIISKLKSVSTLQARVMREENQHPDSSLIAVTSQPIVTPLDQESVTDEQAIVRRNTIHYASASVQITKKVIYDFTQDAEWRRLTEEINLLKAELKRREEFLKKQTDTPAQQTENILVRL